MKSGAKENPDAVPDKDRAENGKAFRPKVGPVPVTDFIFYFVKLYTWIFFPIFFQFRVHGKRHIPLDTGALIASNHQSYMDPVFIGAAGRRRTGYIARKTLFKEGGFFTRLIKILGAIPLSIDSSGKEGVRLAVEHLRRREHILMFPEGTRTRDGSIGDLQPGVKLIAQKANVPIVPAALHGVYEIWPRSRKLLGFGPVSVAFGKPIRPEQLRKMKSGEFCAYLKKRIECLYEKLDREKARRPSL